MMRRGFLAGVFGAMLAVMPAGAQPAGDFTVQEALNFFLMQTLGASRSACLVDCPPPQAQQGFNLFIQFDFDSSVLTQEARTNLTNFAQVIGDPRLAAYRFEIAGHTDASGSETYNLGLSDRRANAAVEFLVGLGISRERLIAIGYGKSRLKNAADPLDPQNRRVEAAILL